MSRFTRRDLAVVVVLAALGVAVAVLAFVDQTRWAIAGLGVLIAVSAIVAHVQFVARRPAYQHLRREIRASRDDAKQLSRSTDRLLKRVESLRRDSESIRRTQRDFREELATVAADTRSLRPELRGIRVAQQLFSQTIVQTRADVFASREEISEVASQLGAALATRAVDTVEDQLRATIGALHWELRAQEPQLLSELQSMQQLFQRFTPDAPLPPLAGWAMSPSGLLMLTDEIARRDAKVVVECGSGSSTLWMALAMRAKGGGKVVAFEHLQEYADRTRALLDAHGVSEWAEVRLAPLTAVATRRGEFQWYDTGEMVWNRNIDVLLVDGPPTKTGHHARYPALEVLGAALNANALVALDDTDRDDEMEVLEMWKTEWPNLSERPSPGRGIAVFEWRGVK